MNKQEAGRLGHLRLRNKLGDGYSQEQARRGLLGAIATRTKYKVVPLRLGEYQMCERSTGKIVARW